jgi:PKD repeat protein
MTLETKQGNAFDTASLLIALLRASGIHARYAYGTVRIPIESVMNWVGGVTQPEAAIQLLAQGGIPVVAQTQGGVIKFAKMEHVRVEAWIDFFPSRGAKHLVGDSWVPLDASFKQYQLTPGMDLPQAVPFNAQALVDHLTQTTTINETEGWVSGLDQNYLQTTLQSYQTQLENYLTQTHPEATVGEVLGTQTIIPANRPVLAAGLPYQVVARGNTFATLPATLRHTLTVTLFESVTAQALDNPSFTVTLSLPVLRSQRLHLTYVPATEMDAQALAHYQNDPNVTQLPLYLFRVKPVLKLEDTVLAEGPAVTMGQPQDYTLTLTDPHQSQAQPPGVVQAGDEVVFTVNGNGLTLDVLKSRAASSRDTPDVAENLHQLGLLFWFEHDWLDSLAARVYQVRTQRLPSVGVFFMPLTVRYLFGIPKSGYYHTRQIDVRRNVQMVVGETSPARFDFMSHIGLHGSYLEGSVLDQLFGQTWMPGRSTTQVLKEAVQQNIPIYTITSTNLQTVLPQLSLTADVREEIINAVSTGKTVVIPQRDVTQGRWVGTGYLIQDPVTGAGAYLIDGGYNGGTWEGCTITVQASVYRQGFIYGALSALQDTFEQLQAELTARLKAEMAVSKQLQENRTQVEQLNQLLDLTVKLFVGALTALGVEPLISGNGCFVAKAKPATADTYVKNQVYVPLVGQPAAGNNEKTAVEFTAEGVTSCWNYQWAFGEGQSTSTDQSPSYSYPGAGKYVVTVSATCQGNPATQTSQVTVYLMGVSLKKLWETQNKTNQIFDPTLKDDPSGVSQIDETDGEATYGIYRHKLYSVSDAQNTYRVSVDLDVQPPELRHRFLGAAYQNGPKINQSDTALPTAMTQPAEMVFVDPSAEPAVTDFDIKVGFDANQNHLLEEEEAKALYVYTPQGGQPRYAIVKGINNAKYEEHRVTIESKINITPDWLNFPAPNARAFLKIFYERGPDNLVNSPYQPTFSIEQTLEAFTNNVEFSEWLTHNAGLEFDAQGKATIQQYIWGEKTKVAQFFAERTPFALENILVNTEGRFELSTPTGELLKQFYEQYVKTEAEPLLKGTDKDIVTLPQGGGFYHFPNEQAPDLFKSLSPAWVKPSTVAVGKDDGYSGFGALFGDLVGGGNAFDDFDAFGVVGRGRVLDPRYQFTVTKEESGIWPLNTEVYLVSSIHFECELEDLYDFNYESGVLASHAAALQIGFGKGINGNQHNYGQIYRHKIIIKHDYDYPFEHTQIPLPTLRKKETTKGE